ncbi:hypothetical protein CIB84_011899 [Bambusicola thoracicus]|uniref:Ig-like domain-containing protein n=1 Tax=Bambusicola thoracicus TaxID=9083 RepID=A0A2P4SJQ7_BAMTH|nr:hypothetical protein CIB84_011899 [Bambusicola thoracicus]
MSCCDQCVPCQPCGPTPLASSCNEPCVRQCQPSTIVIQPSPVVVTLPGPILSSFPQNTAVGSSTSAAVGSILSSEGVPITSGGLDLSCISNRYCGRSTRSQEQHRETPKKGGAGGGGEEEDLRAEQSRGWRRQPVAVSRAQVQQEPSAETSEGTGINITCSHPNTQSYEYIHWYRQLQGQGPTFLVNAFTGSKEVPDPEGQLSVSADRRSSALWLKQPRLGDAALYYCALVARGEAPGLRPGTNLIGRGGSTVPSGPAGGAA